MPERDRIAPPRTAFADKSAARTYVWRQLQERRAASFPFPVEGRIPNFVGARAAAERLVEHPLVRASRRLKVNPDSPQRPFRELALRAGIELLLPTPKLAGGFRLLDPTAIPAHALTEAATLSGAERWGRLVPLAELPSIDAVISGSVAVTPAGRRCGKGHGYGDLEFAMLRELGHPVVPVLTSVHELQIVEDFPADAHDLPVSVIVTPERIIEVPAPPPAPEGIDWTIVTTADLEAMPILTELRPT